MVYHTADYWRCKCGWNPIRLGPQQCQKCKMWKSQYPLRDTNR